MFKRLLSLAAAALAAVSAAAAVSAETEYRGTSVSAPPVMVVLGDSIATGYGLEGYDGGKDKCASYANLLKDKFTAELPEDCGFKLTNFAVDGFTSADLLDLLNSGELDEDLAEASCITVSTGGNDLLHALWTTLQNSGIGSGNVDKEAVMKLLTALGSLKSTLEENLVSFESNLEGIALYIRSKTSAEVFVQTLYDPLESFSMIPGLSSLAEEKVGALNEIIVKHSTDKGAEYSVSDVASKFKGKAQELTNISRIDIHPNAEGHKVIAEVLGKSITSKSYTYMQAVEVEESKPVETEPAVTEPAETEPASSETAPEVSSETSSEPAVTAGQSSAAEAAAEPVSSDAPADTDAGTDSVTSLQGNSGTTIAIICAVCALAAVAAAIVIIKKKRS